MPAVIVPTHGRALERSEVDAMVAPVDFALDGDDALACTRELGQQLGTRIVLMHSAETRAALSDASVAGRVGRRLKDGLYALAVQGMRAFMGLATPLRTVERMVRLSELPVLILPPAWLAAHSPLLPTPLK
ncbi:MAG: hypothetical protein U1F43_19325 [Myxococcota bacterium]